MTSDAVRAYRPGLPDPAPLLAEYSGGDFLFATAERTLLARGTAVDLSGLAVDAVGAAVAESEASLAVGVLPYDDAAHRPCLVVPRSVQVADAVRAGSLDAVAVAAPLSLAAVPPPDEHVAAVREAVDAVRRGDSAKVVLARVLDVAFSDGVRPSSIVNNLVADNPDGFTFAAALPPVDGVPRTLVGSSPELLVRRTGRMVTAHPQAGTAARSDDPDVDRSNAASLLSSAKDLSEHQIVVDAVVEALRPFCRSLSVPSEPSLTSTPAVWHLGTQVAGELSDDVSALHLAMALHPTPAVCGAPTAAARELVSALEPFDRGYYAGAVGWVDAAGDGEWAVTIRCAEMASSSMRLYAGGGIVGQSDPDAELAETTAKFTTLLRAMGVDSSAL